jgi:hypothetical protein
MQALDRGARRQVPPDLAVQFGIAGRYLGIQAAETLSLRLKVSADCRNAAANAIRHLGTLARTRTLSAEEWLALLTGLDALRRPERLETLLAIHAAWAPPGREESIAADHTRSLAALQVLAGIDYGGVHGDGEISVVERVRQLRLRALREWLARTAAGN